MYNKESLPCSSMNLGGPTLLNQKVGPQQVLNTVSEVHWQAWPWSCQQLGPDPIWAIQTIAVPSKIPRKDWACCIHHLTVFWFRLTRRFRRTRLVEREHLNLFLNHCLNWKASDICKPATLPVQVVSVMYLDREGRRKAKGMKYSQDRWLIFGLGVTKGQERCVIKR